MATHDYVIANGTGSAVRADLNNALAAIVSNNSSSSEPATKYAYQWWADTTTGQLKLRNAANNGWVTIFELDGTMLMEDGTVSAPGLAFASDLNTGFFRSAADKINFATGGVERLEIGSSEVVFNDGSNDVDFRVESNGQTHMLFVDGGNDRVGIGTSSPSVPFTVQSDSGTNAIAVLGRSADDISSTLFYENDGTTQIGRIQARQSYLHISGTDNTKGIYIDNSGNVGIGATSPSYALDVKTSAETACRLDSGSSNNAILRFAQAGVNKAFIQYPNGGGLTFGPAGSEAARLDSSSRLLVGCTANPSNKNTVTPTVVVDGSGVNGALQINRHTSPGGGGSQLLFSGTRGSSVSSYTAVQSGDGLGTIDFMGADGGEFVTAAQIQSQVDGTPGDNDMPGRLVFSTTADGASSPTERLRILSDGTIATGGLTATPGTVAAGSYIQHAANAGFFGNNGDAKFGSSANNSVSFQVNGSEKARIDTSGRLLVGTTAEGAPAAEKLTLEDSGNCGITIRAGTTSYSTIYFSDASSGTGEYAGSLQYGHSDNSLRFGANSLERMRLDSSGNLFFASFDDSSNSGFGAKINITTNSGDVKAQCISTASQYTQLYGGYFGASVTFYVLANGNVLNTNNSYGQISDQKLKENIVDANSQWNNIKDVRVRNFNFIEGQTHTQIGVVAQELEAVSPGLIDEAPDRDEEGNDLGTVTKSVKYSVLYMKAVKALQEAMTRIETLETKVAALEAG